MLSIVICTYNRYQILEIVINHLTEIKHFDLVELIVVDNNSTDQTSSVVQHFVSQYDNIHYIFEQKQGLSIARNTGHHHATKPFVVYLDDDALADENMIMRIEDILKEHPQIEAFGGAYYPWYHYGQPHWFKDKYASKTYTHRGLKVLTNTTWSGGIMIIKRALLKKFPFREDLGMTGTKTMYGEETELQFRLKKNGINVYGTNDVFIKHIVQDYKLNVQWFFKQKKGIAESLYFMQSSSNLKFLNGLKGLLFGGVVLVKDSIINTPKLLKKGYYKENFIIDSFTKPYKWWTYSKLNFNGNK